MNSLQYRQLAKRIEDTEKQLIKLDKTLDKIEKALAASRPARKETLGLPKKANNA